MTTTLEKIEKFFDSPANQTGLVAWAATAIVAGIQWYHSGMVSPADLAGVAFGLAKIVLPDNSITQNMLLKAGVDIQAALKNPDQIGLVLADGATIIAAAKPVAPIPPTSNTQNPLAGTTPAFPVVPQSNLSTTK